MTQKKPTRFYSVWPDLFKLSLVLKTNKQTKKPQQFQSFNILNVKSHFQSHEGLPKQYGKSENKRSRLHSLAEFPKRGAGICEQVMLI